MSPGRNFVEENMGSKYVEAARLEFDKLYEDSDSSTPVFFILSPGVDPLKDVEKLGILQIVCYLHSMYLLVGMKILNILSLQDWSLDFPSSMALCTMFPWDRGRRKSLRVFWTMHQNWDTGLFCR